MTPAFATRWHWLAAALLILAEFLVFDGMTSRYHASVYPRWTDQGQYLTEAYTACQVMKDHGLWAALKSTLVKPSLQGTLHDFFAVLVFWVVGSPSRSAVLSLNMLALLVWQGALLATIPRVSGSRTLSWMTFSLVLCVAWPWSADAGSAVDFRLDHGAMCLLGLTATLALLTNGFRATGWSLAFGLAAAVTLLERFLTGVYFAGIFAACVAWILCGDARWLRLRNLLLAGLIMTLLAGPVFWLNRTSIYNYYWVGHMASADADARAAGTELWPSARYVFGYLGRLQLGAWFGWTAAALTLTLVTAAVAGRRKPAGPLDRSWLFFALIFLVVPAAVLCLHRQKSFYVLGVLVPGVILLVAWLWAALWRRIDFTGRLRFLPAALAVAAVGAGGGFFLQRQLTPPHSAEFIAGVAKINQIADHLFTTSRRAGLSQPRYAVDIQNDYFYPRTMNVLCYERQKQWLNLTPMLPVGIIEEKDEFIMDRLGRSDFVLLTDVLNEHGFYPYDRQMRRLYPVVKAWCEANLRHIETFPIFGRQMSLYQRRDLP